MANQVARWLVVPAHRAYAAALGGRLDAFWEFGRDTGNLLAGVLVAGEAGAVVTEPALHARLVPLSGG